jgi:hypothetical protein
VLVALVQEPQVFEQPIRDDSFHDILDVAGIAIPLALAVLLLAVGWPGLKRWTRHRIRRHRRRRHQHNAHPRAPMTP